MSYIVFLMYVLISVHAAHLKADQNVHPNVGEITSEYKKMVKPFYQKDFFPQEVASIKEKVVVPAYNFQNAEIVGTQEKGTGINEKPTIYETVITRRGTSVVHPVPKLSGSTTLSNADALYSKNPAQDFPVRTMSPGEYAIPVHLETNSNNMEANQKGYETPLFTRPQNEINRMASKISEEKHFGEQIFMTQVKEDVSRITSRIRGVKKNKDKIKILKKGIKSLESDAKKIADGIQKDVTSLINSKQTALSMNNALLKYEMKLKKSQMSKLKLSDVITIKKKLAKKLTKELQGFRTASSNYAELSKVNGSDIKRIIKKIKKQLNH